MTLPDSSAKTITKIMTHTMRRFLNSPALGLVLGWVCAGLFGLSSWGKLRDPLAFADSIAAYQLVPWRWAVSLLALVIPVLELLLAALVLANVWRRAAVLAMAGLTVVFTVALVSAAARGLEIDCGCMGGGSGLPSGAGQGGWGLPELSVPWAIARNVVLLFCFWGLLMFEKKPNKIT
jgi:uncharacterized membrane protein YphA (DoxX/SURF4 family)